MRSDNVYYKSDDEPDTTQRGVVQIRLEAMGKDGMYMEELVPVKLADLTTYCKENKNCHEVLTGEVKPYFDIENYYATEAGMIENQFRIIESAAAEVQKAFPTGNVMTFDSSGASGAKWKQSCRVIVKDGGKFESGLDILEFAKTFHTPGIDLQVYKTAGKQQNVRIPYAVKLTDETRQLKRAYKEKGKWTLLTEENCLTLGESMPDWMISFTDNEKLCRRKPQPTVAQKTISTTVASPNASELEQVVMGLSDARAASYQGAPRDGQWLEVLMVIKNSETYPDEFLWLAHKFSLKCPEKYSEPAVEKKYRELGGGSKKIGSLYEYLKQDNKALFNKLQEQKKLERQRDEMKIIVEEMEKPRELSGREWTAFDFTDFVKQMESTSEIDFAELMEYISETQFYMFNGGNAFWYTKNRDKVKGITYTQVLNGSAFTGKRDFDISFQAKGKKINTTMDTILEQTKFKRIKSEFVFQPYFGVNDVDPNKMNIFTGFAQTPRESFVMTEPVQFILNHLRILCGEEESVFTYTQNWLATFLQQPLRKLTFLVSIARQGSGRGTFFDEIFAQRIVGKKYCKTINDMDLLVGRFNSAVKNCLFGLVAESKNNCETVSNNEKFKSLITDVSAMIEDKNVDPYAYDNYGKYCLLSNHPNPVVISADDRRTVVMESTNNHIQDKDEKRVYFTKLHKYKDDPEVMRDLFTYFATLDIEGWDDTDRPITAAYIRMQGIQLPSALAHIKYCCSNEQADLSVNSESGFVNKTEMYRNYTQFCQNTGVKPSPEKYYVEEIKAVGIDLDQAVRQSHKGKRKVGVVFKTDDIEKAFQMHLKRPTFNFAEYVPLDEDL